MSSNDSLGFISDDLLSRSADDDWEQLAVRPLDESVGDDAFSGSVPVLRESPRSSTAGSSAPVDELRRRDSLSRCDPLGSGSALSGSFIPRLGDEELDDVKTDESTSDETVPGPNGVAGPSADVVDYFGPTRTSSKSLANALRSCSAPPSISISEDSVEDLRIPNYRGWKVSPVRYPKFLDPFPDQLKVDLDKIRAEGRKIMGKFNLDVVPDYSQRYKEKRPASETPTPNPSRSEERQTREATKKSLLDKGGRHSQQAGSSRPLSPASERAKRDEMVNSRASRQVGGCPAGAGPPTNVQGRTGEMSTRKRARNLLFFV
ncbi:unnamed protein product [Arabidopsis thaliana]|uniref:(thale cress) hypothetical protein n=1 Tax=Arabidopsis thaliana TaxID=3702 RepID=A0A7G2E261_ARATH|nr:unnamed protein product [Arabidopsis thaliana]CAD5315523.1 unnamed protein product [Arabidopsis thaliana]CAD5315526.1 unnamed protein product [Arabidopsis thaliana]